MPGPINTGPAIPALPAPAARYVALQHMRNALIHVDTTHSGIPVGIPDPSLAAQTSVINEAADAAASSIANRKPGISTPAPTARLSQAASDATQAIRVLQAATFSPADAPLKARFTTAIDHLAAAAAGVSTAPTSQSLASARQNIVDAAKAA